MDHSKNVKKTDVKTAQAKHLADLFGDEVTAPPRQQADDHAKHRGQQLSDAAAKKRQAIDAEEQASLQRAAARQRPPQPASASPASVAPNAVPPPVAEAPTDRPPLHKAASRNSLAEAALQNIQRQAQQRQQAPPAAPPPEPAPVVAPPPAPDPEPVEPSPPPLPPPDPIDDPVDQPAAVPPPPAGDQPRSTRKPPNPQELEKLLQEMAARAKARRAAATDGQTPPAPTQQYRPSGASPEGAPDIAPQAEAPPKPPEESPEKRAEQQAEILKELQAKEATAQQHVAPIPQSDQERAEVKPLEAEVSLQTSNNALRSDALHATIVSLQQAVRAKDPTDQVGGVNAIQEQLPNHPLYKRSEQ